MADAEQHTQVFELKTTEDVELFCRMLTRLKETAPGSLTFQVAVTAERSVKFRGTKNGVQRGPGLVGRVLDKVGKRL